jgi:hypothetical protein
MDQDFQISVLWQKVDFARSANPTIVCNAITDINSVLAMLSINDDDLLEPLDTAFEVADMALGFGETKLEGTYAHQVRNLIDEFAQRLEKRIAT